MSKTAKWIFPLAIVLAGACSGMTTLEGDPVVAAPPAAPAPATTGDPASSLSLPSPPEDAAVEAWLTRLDSLMTIPENAYDIFGKGRKHLRAFSDSLRTKLLTPEQTGSILAYMDELLTRHPEAWKLIGEQRYLAWWDESTRGPIATSWIVWAWPTTYTLDGKGVIRYVNTREEQLIEAVDALLREQRAVDPAHPTM